MRQLPWQFGHIPLRQSLYTGVAIHIIARPAIQHGTFRASYELDTFHSESRVIYEKYLF
jgi:hypothetical protein